MAVLKGFSDGPLLAECRLRLECFPHRELLIPDEGFDIDAYAAASARLSYRYLVFLNSFSVLQDAEWLLKLYRHVTRDGVGVVGATGSWSKTWGDLATLNYCLQGKPLIKRLYWYSRFPFSWALSRTQFAPYPNPHIRTNGFMLSRELFLRLRLRPNRSKMDVYRFESGHRGMTRQILGLGLRALVVGRDGRAYDQQDWPASNTFWRRNQENLLVADNQTRAYSEGDESARRRLAFFAWQVEDTVSNPATWISER
jgi:hypothetical protein